MLKPSMSRRPDCRKVYKAFISIFIVIVFFVAFSCYAQAQKKKGGGVIQLEEITIEGKIQKPNAFYILERQGLGFQIMELKTSFIQEIVDQVKNKPF